MPSGGTGEYCKPELSIARTPDAVLYANSFATEGSANCTRSSAVSAAGRLASLRLRCRSPTNTLNHFDAIWRLQSYLLSEADRAHVPIVPNDDLDRAIQQLLRLVLDELSRHYEGRPEDVWA